MLPIANFVYGEVSPTLEGREDIPSYFSGCRKMANLFPLVHGAARRRSGTKYVNSAKYADKAIRLIPFIFSVDESYVLEFGDRYMRIHHNGGTLTQGSVPYELATVYSDADLEGINFCQSADIMFIVHPEHRPYQLSRYGELDWRFTPMIFTNPIVLPKPNVEMVKDASAVPPPDTDKIEREYGVTLVDNEGKETEISQGAKLATPYILDYVQKARVELAFGTTDELSGTATIMSGKPMKVYDFEALTGTDAAITVSSITVTTNDRSYTAKIGLQNEHGEVLKEWSVHPNGSVSKPNWSSATVEIPVNELITIEADSAGRTTFKLSMSETNLNINYTGSHPIVREMSATIKYSIYRDPADAPVDNAKYMIVYRKVNGIWSYVGRAKWEGSRTVFDDDGTYAPDVTKNPPVYENNFNAPGDYPCTVAFDSQRLIFGGTVNKPSTIWGSMTGHYDNFAKYESQDDVSPYEYTLASRQINAIRWMVPANKLLIGTAGSEWALSSADGGSVTATSVFAKSQTAVGGSGLAMARGTGALFINRTGQEVRTLSYSNAFGGYDSSSLSLFAEHLTRHRRIVSWAWVENPHNMAWCVCDDGKLLALTYNQQHEVVAWSSHDTDGFFEGVTVVPAEGADEAWFAVRREVNGTYVRYIERLMPDFKTDITEAFFVDSGISYRGESTRRMLGLSHLEGKAVQILADGSIHAPRVVEHGAVELDVEASVIHAGLAYSSHLESHNLAQVGTGESISSRKRRLDKVSVRFEDTLGGRFYVKTPEGCSFSEELFYRHVGDVSDTALKPFTGIKEVVGFGGYPEECSLNIEQNQPLPMTVLAIYPRVTVTGG